MGKQRNSEVEEESNSDSYKSESISLSSSLESPPRKRLKKKYKRSHKYKLEGLEDISEDENEYSDRKKHKHKHKKHKKDIYRHRSDHYEETESSRHHKHKHTHRSSSHKIRSKHRKHSNELDSRSRHSSHRKRDKYHSSEECIRRDIKEENEDNTEQQSSRSEEHDENHHLPHIKTEPITDSSEEDSQLNDSRNECSRPRQERTQTERNENKQCGTDIPVKEEVKVEEKQTVNMGLSGKLTEDANMYNGIVVKYSQPPEARKPKRRWRWYIFKGDEELPFLPLHRQSAYLIGRERKVADIPTDHPSCSKQHAVFQYRLVSYEREDGTTGRTVKPYILDLGSANGTYVNNRRVDPRRYVELMEKDVVKFGYSSREYVLLHEASKGSDDELPDVGADLSPVSLLMSQ